MGSSIVRSAMGRSVSAPAASPVEPLGPRRPLRWSEPAAPVPVPAASLPAVPTSMRTRFRPCCSSVAAQLAGGLGEEARGLGRLGDDAGAEALGGVAQVDLDAAELLRAQRDPRAGDPALRASAPTVRRTVSTACCERDGRARHRRGGRGGRRGRGRRGGGRGRAGGRGGARRRRAGARPGRRRAARSPAAGAAVRVAAAGSRSAGRPWSRRSCPVPGVRRRPGGRRRARPWWPRRERGRGSGRWRRPGPRRRPRTGSAVAGAAGWTAAPGAAARRRSGAPDRRPGTGPSGNAGAASRAGQAGGRRRRGGRRGRREGRSGRGARGRDRRDGHGDRDGRDGRRVDGHGQGRRRGGAGRRVVRRRRRASQAVGVGRRATRVGRGARGWSWAPVGRFGVWPSATAVRAW